MKTLLLTILCLLFITQTNGNCNRFTEEWHNKRDKYWLSPICAVLYADKGCNEVLTANYMHGQNSNDTE
jgi:hypothetical protein